MKTTFPANAARFVVRMVLVIAVVVLSACGAVERTAAPPREDRSPRAPSPATALTCPIVRPFAPDDGVKVEAVDPRGRFVARGLRSGVINYRSLPALEAVEGIGVAHSAAVRSLAFRADGEVLASFGDDGLVRLWDVHTGKMLVELPREVTGGGGRIWDTPIHVRWLGNEALAIAASELRVIDLATRTVRVRAPIDVRASAFATSEDGTRIAMRSGFGRNEDTRMYDARDLRVISDAPFAFVSTLVFRPGTTELAIVDESFFKLFDRDDLRRPKKVVDTWSNGMSGVGSIGTRFGVSASFSRDGRRIAIVSMGEVKKDRVGLAVGDVDAGTFVRLTRSATLLTMHMLPPWFGEVSWVGDVDRIYLGGASMLYATSPDVAPVTAQLVGGGHGLELLDGIASGVSGLERVRYDSLTTQGFELKPACIPNAAQLVGKGHRVVLASCVPPNAAMVDEEGRVLVLAGGVVRTEFAAGKHVTGLSLDAKAMRLVTTSFESGVTVWDVSSAVAKAIVERRWAASEPRLRDDGAFVLLDAYPGLRILRVSDGASLGVRGLTALADSGVFESKHPTLNGWYDVLFALGEDRVTQTRTEPDAQRARFDRPGLVASFLEGAPLPLPAPASDSCAGPRLRSTTTQPLASSSAAERVGFEPTVDF